MQHHYIVIMAGGSGTRLWPLSRRARPKQFHAFLSQETLLQETYARALSVLPAEQIFVSTTEDYAPLVQAQLPALPHDRLILEPEARNTAPAITLVAAAIRRHDPEGVVATIASDHAIDNEEEFLASLTTALATVAEHPENLTTIGINPTRPDTGLGYIKLGKEFSKNGGRRIFYVDDFKEKPDAATAQRYVESWEYLWNAGYFIFRADTFLRWVAELAPALAENISALTEHAANDGNERLRLYQNCPKEAVEPLIIEQLSRDQRLVVPSSLRWSDVGNWSTLFDFLKEKKGASLLSEGQHIDLGSRSLFVKSTSKPVFTLGLDNIVIVETEDAILVADKDAASTEMKALIEKLSENGHAKLL